MDPADFRADETGSLFKPSSASSSIPIFVSVVRANAQHVLIAFTTQKLQAKIDIYERKTRKLVRTFARDCLRVITSEFVRDSNMVVSLTNEGDLFCFDFIKDRWRTTVWERKIFVGAGLGSFFMHGLSSENDLVLVGGRREEDARMRLLCIRCSTGEEDGTAFVSAASGRDSTGTGFAKYIEPPRRGRADLVVTSLSFGREDDDGNGSLVNLVFVRDVDRKNVRVFFRRKGQIEYRRDLPQVTRGLDQCIGSMCTLMGYSNNNNSNNNSNNKSNSIGVDGNDWRGGKLCVCFSEACSDLNQTEFARHIVRRDSIVRIVTFDIKFDVMNNNRIVIGETHRVTLEDSIVASPIDLDSMTSSPKTSNEYVFFAHINGDVSVVNHRNGKVLRQLNASHDPRSFQTANAGGLLSLKKGSLLVIGGGSCKPSLFGLRGNNENVTSCWSIGTPFQWTRETHKEFPEDFKKCAKQFVLCASLRHDDASARSSKKEHAKNSKAAKLFVCSSNTPTSMDYREPIKFTEKDFAEIVREIAQHEPAIIERIVAALASVSFGSLM
jgi:hypothetical protein